MSYSATEAVERPQVTSAPAEKRSKSAAATPDKKAFLAQRLVSLDVYRGLIMVTLAFNGFGLRGTAVNHLRQDPNSSFWAGVSHHFDHVEWTGCGYWDLI